MARFPTLGPGDKVRDKHLPDRLSEEALDGSYAPLWQPSTAYLAGQVVTANGIDISRNADGTSRANYDATEQALWTRVTAPASGAGSPDAALTTATGRAIAFAVALG